MTHRITCRIERFASHYDIEIGQRILTAQAPFLTPLASKFAIVTDDINANLYGRRLHQNLVEAGLSVYLLSFPHGEQHKTRATKELIENQLLDQSFGRDSCIIALGGGVVTDLAGYVAATYCRGVPLVMIPTSLMGMVDASIGGKTGVNVPQGKNMLGCIYQPKKVVIDIDTLATLPAHEIANGFVEIIKHGLIADAALFHTLESCTTQLLALDPTPLASVIFDSCRIKKEIVEHDEREFGKRSLLNFGHTVGHALESVTHYTLSHGEAVAVGMLVEGFIAVQMGLLSHTTLERIRTILERYQLPLQVPANLGVDSMVDAMRLDKKARQGQIRFVLLRDIGVPMCEDGGYCFVVEEPMIKSAIQWMNDALCCH